MPVIPVIAIILVFSIGAFIKGWSGFGSNLIIPPLLLILYLGEYPSIAMVITVSVNFLLNLLMVLERKNLNLQLLSNYAPLVIPAVLFSLGIGFFLDKIDTSLFNIVFGLLIILATLNRIYQFRFSIDNPTKYFIPIGILSGIINGLTGLGGLPVLILLSSTKMEKEEFKQTLVSFFMVMNVVFIVTQAINLQYTAYVFTNIGIVTVFALIACYLGILASRRVSDKYFSIVLNIILILFGINMVYTGLFDEHILLLFQ
jgi:uncharacterized membrane protein YfcA